MHNSESLSLAGLTPTPPHQSEGKSILDGHHQPARVVCGAVPTALVCPGNQPLCRGCSQQASGVCVCTSQCTRVCVLAHVAGATRHAAENTLSPPNLGSAPSWAFLFNVTSSYSQYSCVCMCMCACVLAT